MQILIHPQPVMLDTGPWQMGRDMRKHLCLKACLVSLPLLAGPLEVVISPYQFCLMDPQAIVAATLLWLWETALTAKFEV